MSIFKAGNKIHDFQHGKGEILDVSDGLVEVLFSQYKWTFKEDEALARLSFAPYDLIKGGFSQERPKPEIEKGTVIYVKSKKRNVWQLAYFERFEDGDAIVNFDKDFIGSSAGFTYEEYSLLNPLTEKS